MKSGVCFRYFILYCQERIEKFIDYSEPKKRVKKWGYELDITDTQQQWLEREGKNIVNGFYASTAAYIFIFFIYWFCSPLLI